MVVDIPALNDEVFSAFLIKQFDESMVLDFGGGFEAAVVPSVLSGL